MIIWFSLGENYAECGLKGKRYETRFRIARYKEVNNNILEHIQGVLRKFMINEKQNTTLEMEKMLQKCYREF